MLLMKNHIILLITMLCSLYGIAQDSTLVLEEPVEDYTAETNFHPFRRLQANNHFNNHDYEGALRLYSALNQEQRASASVLYKAGLCAYQLKAYRNAIQYFQSARSVSANVKPDLGFYLGRSYHALGVLDSARLEYLAYLSSTEKDTSRSGKVSKFITQCDYAKLQMDNPVKGIISAAPEFINSSGSEYSPVLLPDGRTLLFTSRRDDSTGRMRDENDHQFYEDIYISIFDSLTNSWSSPRGLSEYVNGFGHDALAGVSPDGKTIFIYKNVNGGDLFQTQKDVDGTWQSPVALSINTPYFEHSASITADGQTLYFVSNRPGGRGQGDIYRVSKTANGEWGDPRLLDSLINTTGDEIACYITPDGTTLYFSSDDHENMGGYDIFKVRILENQFDKPSNMGYPINTTADDLNYFPIPSKDSAWLSSIRSSGSGGRDIFTVDFKEPVKENEQITEVVFEGKKPIPLLEALPDIDKNNLLVEFIKRESEKKEEEQKNNARIEVIVKDENNKDLAAEISIQNQDNKTLLQQITDSLGMLNINLKPKDLLTASMTTSKTGFETVSSTSNVITDSVTKEPFVQVTVQMKQKSTDTLKLLNFSLDTNKYVIVFDLNSAVIPVDNRHNEKLDQVIALLKADKKLHVNLRGHADITGTADHNLALSKKRAKSAADYLFKHGIDAKRIKTIGKGSSEPIATNETEEGRRTNRRVEIRIY